MTPTSAIKESSRLTKAEWREYTKTVWQIANITHVLHPAVFPPEIPRRLIKMFSFVRETVLDPFAGVGTTAKVAIELSRRAVCVEQSKVYTNRIAEDMGSSIREGLVSIHVGDCREMGFLDSNSIDLIVTSPPYWNKANYGKGPKNIGNLPRYSDFLVEMKKAFGECFRVLRPGRKLCVVTANVNQHTDHGLLTFPLAADFALILRQLGFVMINEIIWTKDGTGGRWGSWGTQRPIFGSYPYPPNFLFKNVHEYVLIFAKPSGKRTNGPKVVDYLSAMGLRGYRSEGHLLRQLSTTDNGHRGRSLAKSLVGHLHTKSSRRWQNPGEEE